MSVNLYDLAFFKNLSSQEVELIRMMAAERHFPKGTTIFLDGDESDGFYIIVSGLIKVLKLHGDGREKTLDIIKEGEVLGEMTLVGSNLRSASAITLKETRALVFPGRSFQRLISDLPLLATNIIEILSRRLRNANSQIEALSFLNARSRVIYNLLHLAREHGEARGGGIEITLQLSQLELANLCGVSRQVVNRVFSEFRQSGLIEMAKKQLRILDLDGLHKQLMVSVPECNAFMD